MSALLLGATAGAAYAAEPTQQSSRVRPTGSEFSEAPWSAPTPLKQLQWDSKGRWGLRLDMNQPANRNSDWKDVQAGAYFRITPSLQVGGSVGLGDRLASQPRRVTPQDAAPRVHLETAFRF